MAHGIILTNSLLGILEWILINCFCVCYSMLYKWIAMHKAWERKKGFYNLVTGALIRDAGDQGAFARPVNRRENFQ